MSFKLTLGEESGLGGELTSGVHSLSAHRSRACLVPSQPCPFNLVWHLPSPVVFSQQAAHVGCRT